MAFRFCSQAAARIPARKAIQDRRARPGLKVRKACRACRVRKDKPAPKGHRVRKALQETRARKAPLQLSTLVPFKAKTR